MPIEGSARRSVPWTIGTYVGTKGLNVVTMIGLTRLLSPEDFGTVALATIVVLAVSLLRDSGIGQALIVRKHASPEDTGVALTLILATSVIAAGFMIASAPLVSSLLSDDRLGAVLGVFALSVLLGGPATFMDVLLQREMLFKHRFVAQMVQAGTFSVVAVVLALEGLGIWALVLGQIASVATNTVVLMRLVPYRVRPRYHCTTAVELFRNGRGFLVQAFTSIVQQNVDYLIVGRVLGPASVGYYYMSFRLAELPFMAISDPVSRVTFPALARLRAAGQDSRDMFLRSAWMVTFTAAPLGIALSVNAEPLVRLAFGTEWLPMVSVLTVLGLWGAVRPLQNQYAWYYNACGDAGFIGRTLAVMLVVLIPSIYFAAEFSGTTSVAVVVALQVGLSLLVFVAQARPRLGLAYRAQLRTFGPIAIAAVGAWICGRTVVEAVDPTSHALLSLIAGTLSCAAGYVVSATVVDRTSLSRLFGTVRSLLKTDE